MIIRLAGKGDVRTLQNLNDEVFVDNNKYDSDLKMDWAQSELGKKYFTNDIEDPNTICLVAEDDGMAVGYVAASPVNFDYRLSKYIEINNMGVSPQYRSQGIGSKLMTECLRIAKERGFERAYVTSYFANTKAVKFYENGGFRKIDVSLEKDI